MAKPPKAAAPHTRGPGVVDATDAKTFVAAAMTRQWEREKKVRTLA
jgi:catalase